MALVDQFGRPAIYQSGSGMYEDTQEHALRLSRPQLDKDFARLMPRAKFRAMLSDSRYIYLSFPLVKGAVEQKANYVSANGWVPNFVGEDEDYESDTKVALKKIMGRSTNKGWRFGKSWDLVGQMVDVDGGVFMLHHKDENGYPLTQFLEAHRIGSRDITTSEVRGGLYDGSTIINGIIYSDDGREIAYNVLGATREEDRQIPVGQMYHITDMRFFSENRPFPAVAHSVLDWYDVKETRGFQKIHNKANSAISIVEANESGTNINANAMPGNTTAAATQTDGGVKIETLEGGLIRYVKAGSGQITAHSNNNPGENWRAFDQTLVDGAMYGMGWRSEMMDLSRLKGAGVRGFADNINQVIRARHRFLSEWAMIDFQWKWSVLQERGDIPAHVEWDQWMFPKPGRFDTDRKYTSQTELEEVRSGRRSMSELIELDGGDEDTVLRRQAKYLKKRQRIAAENGLDPQELGTLSKPGDQGTAESDVSDEQTQQPEEEE